MNTNKSNFIHFYFNVLPFLPKWIEYSHAMENTVEDSPWHREQNVLIHTNMVVSQFIARHDGPEFIIGALETAFHDVGKPGAMEIVHSEERGSYKRFSGHEQVSARLWEDFACEHFDVLERELNLTYFDIFRVGWMIQHHLPYSIKKPEKIRRLKLTCSSYNLDTPNNSIFTDALLSDCYGRVSDDASLKQEGTECWVDDFRTSREYGVQNNSDDQKVLYLLIGPSGAGKSTFSSTIDDNEIFSLDELRLDWYSPRIADAKERYRIAFEKSCEDKQFMSKSNSEFVRILKETTHQNVIVDNVNLSVKRRAFYVNEARRKGYTIRGVLFPISKASLMQRQRERSDKVVPVPAVETQYMGVHLPSSGEVDVITVWNGTKELFYTTNK